MNRPWLDGARFSRKAIEALDHPERRYRLGELEVLIDAKLDSFRIQWDPFWREVTAVIEDLKAAGHDLWRHDYDGERRCLWGFDYGKTPEAGQLQIQFDYEGPTKTFWRDLNGVYGCENEDATYESYGIRPPRD
ncbi:MAG: hypothetical protein JSR45_00275 [Proteobacteria bacterium]|nr:hypothetical protein [Pseudomonadota bacterium]